MYYWQTPRRPSLTVGWMTYASTPTTTTTPAAAAAAPAAAAAENAPPTLSCVARVVPLWVIRKRVVRSAFAQKRHAPPLRRWPVAPIPPRVFWAHRSVGGGGGGLPHRLACAPIHLPVHTVVQGKARPQVKSEKPQQFTNMNENRLWKLDDFLLSQSCL